MLKSDIQILPIKDGEFLFSVLGDHVDCNLMILQRVFTLLLATNNNGYRPDASGNMLLEFTDGANYPPEGVMSSVISLCCTDVLNQLDEEDRNHIAQLTGFFEDGKIQCTLTFTDNTTLTGAINV